MKFIKSVPYLFFAAFFLYWGIWSMIEIIFSWGRYFYYTNNGTRVTATTLESDFETVRKSHLKNISLKVSYLVGTNSQVANVTISSRGRNEVPRLLDIYYLNESTSEVAVAWDIESIDIFKTLVGLLIAGAFFLAAIHSVSLIFTNPDLNPDST